jgi:hypothetical protein
MTAPRVPSTELVAQVLALLTELDPYGLEPGRPGGTPADEYDIEARPLADILAQYGRVTAEQVNELWQHYFGEPLSAVVGDGRLEELTAELNRLSSGVRLPAPPDRPADLDEYFADGPSARWWVPHYLPHWTTPDRSEARFSATPGALELRIEAGQLDWRPEDAPLRVSNLQTGTYSGPVGSAVGTHRHRDDDLFVRTETPLRLLFAPSRGRVDVTVAASRDRGCMLAAWLVGSEHLSPEDSGEMCIFEIDADAIGVETTVRSGIKAHHDPRLVTDMAEIAVPLDASQPHTWTVIWNDHETIIGCEGVVVRRMPQAPSYPLFLMIDLFEIGPADGEYPKAATIHRVRGWDLTGTTSDADL